MSILLRPAEAFDIDFIMVCERRPGYEALVGRWPREKHRAVMADGDFRYLIGLEAAAPLGFAILHNTWLRPQNLYLKRLALHDADKGMGRKFLAALNDFVFGSTDTHRFWLEVVEGNSRARHVYGMLGFVVEGLVREGYGNADGTRGNFIQMSILRSEWKDHAA